MPSQTLLNEFLRFPDEKLKKLIAIGDSILSPMDTELTSADFAGMVDQVFRENGLADSYFPEWTDRSKSDFGRFLVELFAVFSDKDFFYINHFSRESFVAVADLYRSIFHQALHQGFNPPSSISASGNIELIFSAGGGEFVPRGAITLGMQEVSALAYTNEPFTIPASSTDQNVTTLFKHGRLRREQIFFDGYSLVIDVPMISKDSIKLSIGSDVWVETNNFVLGAPATKHYMVFYDENGRAEIQFADKSLGAKPSEQALCDLEFIVGGGYIADIEANTLNTVIDSQTQRNLLSYTQSPMTGGTGLMPLELLRTTVIGKARTQNRVVTPEDAEYFCKELSFILKVSAEVFLNFTYIYVLPTGGGAISPSQIILVEDKILPNLLMGYELTVGSPIYVPITMVVNIFLLPTTIKSGANIIASQVIDEYLNPLKNGEFGQGVNRSILASKILQRVVGSQNVTFSNLYRSGVPAEPLDLTFIMPELVDIADSSVTINLIGGI